MSNQRIITVFTSKGGKTKIETDVTTWGELKPLVEETIDLTNLQPTESVTKTTLLHSEAILPVMDFVLFLRPIKQKAGANYSDMSFKELRTHLTDKDKEDLKASTGQNWTRVTRVDIEAQLSKSESKVGTPVNTEIVEEAQVPSPSPKAKKSEDKVQQFVPISDPSITNLDRINTVKDLLQEICDTSDNDEVCNAVDLAKFEVDNVLEAIKNSPKDCNLDEEYAELLKGFDN